MNEHYATTAVQWSHWIKTLYTNVTSQIAPVDRLPDVWRMFDYATNDTCNVQEDIHLLQRSDPQLQKL